MKTTTLLLNSHATRLICCGSIAFFAHFNTFSQEKIIIGELRNIQVPVFANETERQEWIASHPEEYKFLTGQYKEVKVMETGSQIRFPQYVNTGNPEKDEKIYQERKQQWINENPEAYKLLLEKQSIENNK